MPKLSQLPKPPKQEEQIQPDKLARVIKNEKSPAAGDRLKDISVTPENYKKFKGERRFMLPRGIVWGIVALVVLFVAGSIISFYVIKAKVKASISTQVNTLQSGVTDLQHFDFQGAQRQFSQLGGTSTPTFSTVLGVFSSLFQ